MQEEGYKALVEEIRRHAEKSLKKEKLILNNIIELNPRGKTLTAEKTANAKKALRLSQPTALIYRFDDQFPAGTKLRQAIRKLLGKCISFALPFRPLLKSTHLLLKAGVFFNLHQDERLPDFSGCTCGKGLCEWDAL